MYQNTLKRKITLIFTLKIALLQKGAVLERVVLQLQNCYSHFKINRINLLTCTPLKRSSYRIVSVTDFCDQVVHVNILNALSYLFYILDSEYQWHNIAYLLLLVKI